MKLYYRTPKKITLIEKGLANLESALPYINKYLKEIDFKSYYMRVWQSKEGYTILDYGSHVNFFYFGNEELKLEE